jgi:hypothetical protein
MAICGALANVGKASRLTSSGPASTERSKRLNALSSPLRDMDSTIKLRQSVSEAEGAWKLVPYRLTDLCDLCVNNSFVKIAETNLPGCVVLCSAPSYNGARIGAPCAENALGETPETITIFML